MGTRHENAEFQAAELRGLGYDARVVITPDSAIVVRLTIQQAIFIQASTAVANTRESRQAEKHGDGLKPGHRNPYNPVTGKFKGLCRCGEEFWGDDPQHADSLMLDHVEEMGKSS